MIRKTWNVGAVWNMFSIVPFLQKNILDLDL